MICCVTGHRPKGFPFPYGDGNSVLYEIYRNRLYKVVREMIGEGCTTFVSGMAQGVDLDFAEAVLYCREVDFGLEDSVKLEAVIPYPNQAKGWPYEYWDRYQSILLECDQKTLLSNAYHTNCFQLRNEYMVDRVDVVLAVWNGEKKGGTWNTIRYAQRRGKRIRYLLLSELMERVDPPHTLFQVFSKSFSQKSILYKKTPKPLAFPAALCYNRLNTEKGVPYVCHGIGGGPYADRKPLSLRGSTMPRISL